MKTFASALSLVLAATLGALVACSSATGSGTGTDGNGASGDGSNGSGTGDGNGSGTNGSSGGTDADGGSSGTTCSPGTTAPDAGDAAAPKADGGDSGGGTVASGGGALPAHLLTGYWQDFDNGAQTVTLAGVPASYGLVAVAFANADPSNAGAVTFSIDSGLATALGGYTAAQFTSDIATLHGRGQKAILSVGGQNGAIQVSDATSATNFATSVYAIMQQYGFDGVDIDLENGLTPASMASGLQQLAAMAGAGLVITLAPQTIDMQSTTSDYFELALAIKSILTIVNMQYYNSGSMNGADGQVYSEGSVDFLTALAAIQLQGSLRPDQVGLGVPSSTSAAGSGYVAASVVNAALDCLASGTSCGSYTPSAKYPTIRGAMTWSINWDGSNGYAFATAVSGHLATLP